MTDPRRAAAAAALAAALAAPAAAEPLLGPLTLGDLRSGEFEFYGQINKALLVHDDGDAVRAYPFVDNDSSSTRFGAWFRRRAADDLLLSANFEMQWTPYSTADVNRLDDPVNLESHLLRNAEIQADTAFGRFSFGQGSTASDAASEVDLSGTTLAAYSSVSAIAGGQLLALSGGGISGTAIASAFSNFDGLGRLVRARWDSPSVSGFTLSGSIGSDQVGSGPEDGSYDAALRYADTLGGVLVNAAAAVSAPLGERERVNGSAAALHEATGLNAVLAAGWDSARDGRFAYLKLGWRRTGLITSGDTAVSVDASTGRNRLLRGSETLTFGLAAVQQVAEGGVDLYAGLRWYDVDSPAADYEPALSVIAGARLVF
jgi:hypothetical protein